jgi:hypothetical protein
MYARAVDDAATHLRELHHEEWEKLGLGALALGLAVVAAQTRPALALPLLFGGLALAALGVRGLWRRWDLVDTLAGERDAYVISEVRSYASREATIERRRIHAGAIRCLLAKPGLAGPVTEELTALVSELEDEELVLDPDCAIVSARLVGDLSSDLCLTYSEDLRSRARQIRGGFRRS